MELKYHFLANNQSLALTFNRTAYGIEIFSSSLIAAKGVSLLIAPLMELK